MRVRGLAGRMAAATAVAGLAMTQAVAQTAPFVPVTDAMIQQPDPKDWLSWRRTLDSWGYSPLDQVDRGNVDQLRLVWVRPLDAGHQEGHVGTQLARLGELSGIGSAHDDADVAVLAVPFSRLEGNGLPERPLLAKEINLEVLKVDCAGVRGPAPDDYALVGVLEKGLDGIGAAVGIHGGRIRAQHFEDV